MRGRLEFSGQEALRSLFNHLIGWAPLLQPRKKEEDEEESMGAQISKNAGKEEAAVEKPAEGAAVAAKANGQVRRGIRRGFFLSSPLLSLSLSVRRFVSSVAMCCVNGVLHVSPVASPATLAGVQGKWPHVSSRREPFVPFVHRYLDFFFFFNHAILKFYFPPPLYV